MTQSPDQAGLRQVNGRLEAWSSTPAPGGWVCAEPEDPDGADVEMCGHPVGDEPCPIHHPHPLVQAVVNALFDEPLWVTYGDSPLARTLGGPREAMRHAARVAVTTLAPLLAEQIAKAIEDAGRERGDREDVAVALLLAGAADRAATIARQLGKKGIDE